MPAQQSINMLQQLMQQLQSGGFATNAMNQLGQAGLGATNPQQFFSTPFDEQFLRQSVLGNVLGYYGGNRGMQVGNPTNLINGGFGVDPYTGGMNQQADWSRQGFANKFDWKQAGRPRGGNLGNDVSGDISGELGPPNIGLPNQWGNAGVGNYDQIRMQPGDINSGGGNQGQFSPANPQMGFGDNMGGFYNSMQNYNPNVSALNTDYSGMLRDSLSALQSSGGFGNGGADGGGFMQPNSGMSFNPVQFPSLDQTSQGSLNAITQGQLGQSNLDFDKNKQDLMNNLFGRGMNASSVAADAGGRLLYGRQQSLNDIYGQAGQREMQARQALLDSQTQLIKAGAGNASFGGRGGFGLYGGNPGNANLGGVSAVNQLAGLLRGGADSKMPLTFEQQMQLADRQLNQAQLQQQGQLGFGNLGLQQQLGLGSQGLEKQGLGQNFLQFLLNQGLQRQQGAAGMTQADLARMTGYLGNQQQLIGGLGQQSAQIEAQRRSFFSQLMGGLLGGGSALLGAAGQAGGFGHLFGGG